MRGAGATHAFLVAILSSSLDFRACKNKSPNAEEPCGSVSFVRVRPTGRPRPSSRCVCRVGESKLERKNGNEKCAHINGVLLKYYYMYSRGHLSESYDAAAISMRPDNPAI